jgi:hypothetical protein
LGRFDKHAPAILLSVSLLLGATLVALCCVFERTLTLPGDGRGLRNHYGIWAIFIGSPVLVLLVSAIRLKFIHTTQSLNKYTVGNNVPPALQARVHEHIESIDLRKRTRYLLWLFVILGWYWWLVNVNQTLFPFDSYGNDVFDAYPHFLGFFSFKIYLGVLWVLVYPFLAYWTLHIFISMISILKYMSDNELFQLDFFHEDDCGGVSVFGTINSMILSTTFIVFATVLAILLTHKGDYVSIWSSVIVSFILIVVQSILGVYFIHIFVRQKKKEVLATINKYLNASLITFGNRRTFPQDLLAVRNHIAQIRSFPYARGARFLVNFLRLSPAAAGLAKLIWSS